MQHKLKCLINPLLCGMAMLYLWHVGVVADDNTLPPATFAGPCSTWQPVSDGGFGGTGPYNNEEGFEVIVFDGRLYVGMEGDNELGARLWRTKAGVRVPAQQADWEEVAADGNGDPFGNSSEEQNDHIDSLAEFNSVLYASMANRSGHDWGTLIYSSTTGAANSWHSVIIAGFGYTQNTNFKDMALLSVGGTDWLCGGTGNSESGAQIWCTSDGATWTQKNTSGFGDAANSLVASTGVFSAALYVGISHSTHGNVWRTADLLTWTQVFTSPDRPRVEIVGALGTTMYIAAGAYDGRNHDDPTIRLYRSASGNAGTWLTVTTAITQDVHNTRTIVDGATIYNGGLYIAVMNNTTGVEVWRTTEALTWTPVNTDGFGYTTTFAAELIPFGGYLYAWTSDYTRGQQMRRAACPIAQARAITQTGRVDFPGVGATITLTHGSADVITVSVLPGALPTTQTQQLPVARTYHLSIAPATTTFTADITLAYTAAELASAGAASDSLHLTRWNGTTWEACPPDRRASNPISHTVTCREVIGFSVWAITGKDREPTGVKGILHASSWPPLGGLLLGGIIAVGCLAVWLNHKRA